MARHLPTSDEEKEDIIQEVFDRQNETDSVVEEAEEEVLDDDATDDPEEGAEPDSEVESEEPALYRQVVARAQQYGYTPEALSVFNPSNEQLEEALAAYDRLLLVNQQAQAQSQQQAPATSKPAPELDVDEIKKLLEGFDEDDPNRQVVEKLLQHSENSSAKVTQLEGYMQSVVAMEQQRQFEEVYHRFNQALDSMDTTLYGSGNELTPEQDAARTEALKTAGGLLQVELNRGNYQVDFSEVARRSANAVHSKQLSKEQNKPKADKIKARSQRRSNVGTRKRTSRTKLTAEQKELYDRQPSADPAFMAEIRNLIDSRS